MKVAQLSRNAWALMRICTIALGMILIGTSISGSVFAQSQTAQGGANGKSRGAIAAQLNRKMPACKAEAKRQKISTFEHRSFIRQCLKG
jgi:hypothetical protein